MDNQPACGIPRRRFLGTVSAGAAFSILPRHVLGGPGRTPPSETVHIAVIGVGGQGMNDLRGLLGRPDARVVAVADPALETDYSQFYYRSPGGRGPALAAVAAEDERRAGGGKGAPRCAGYVDYREMLERERGIDAVLVATPDHVHAVATMAAIRRGKHVFCEKPLTHSIHEARALREAAAGAGIVSQMGNQGHCGEGFALAVEWVRAGAVGEVGEVVCWSGRSGRSRGAPERPAGPVPVPATMEDWDLWIGPAPYRDYHPDYAPFKWRRWWDFGNGGLGDMGCHNLDQAFAALDLEHPARIEAEGTWHSREAAPDGCKVTWHCPAKGGRGPVKVTWFGGVRGHEARPPELDEGSKLDDNGLLIRGPRGVILCPGWAGAPRLLPAAAMEAFERPPATLPRVKGGHLCDWLDSIKAGRKSLADFDYSARLTEFVLLGCLAQRVGKPLAWDGPAMRVTDVPEANRFVRPEYREGWSL